ncbi:sulfotransferase domain-containing protein [Rhizobium sp. PAMB 3174]
MVLRGKLGLKKRRDIQNAYDDVPENPLHSDLYLVSFPKSGVTWLTFIFANLIAKMNNDATIINFFNVDDYVPDIHVSRHLDSRKSNFFPYFRIIKSHSPYNPAYRKNIYLIRNPVNVLISYYKFLSYIGKPYQGSFEKFVEDPRYGVEAWREHVNSWVRSPPSRMVTFVRFEDLRSDTVSALKGLTWKLGVEIPQSVIEAAIDASSLESMKNLELLQISGLDGIRFSKTANFVGDGKISTDEATISEQATKKILEATTKERALFGYQ